ncbi:E3 ubiquitin-protein ligase RNF123-like [Aricia agestis]|uniref:E3 ubiquitin-protein ligase RNF123-like n=1 Tax=Aricia agestis TaxID=91739 RepID=UPI001C20730B|nr:E3 ubiquitin-protein ligase RNF123-like [Aricia agestis]
MNVLRNIFGVCSSGGSGGEKSEVTELVRRVFGPEMVIKETDKQNQRSRYISHIREHLPKIIDAKISSQKPKLKKKTSSSAGTTEGTDEQSGRIGHRVVIFDAFTGSGRLVLAGDERVSVQGLSSFSTVKATACACAGNWMFEVHLGTKGIMQIGWCSSSCSFTLDTGVGDTAHSYSYDGCRQRKWNVATSPYGTRWAAGDVIGSCLDLDHETLEFYRNGVSLGPAFEGIPRGAGLAYFPAVSLAMHEHLYANFGHVPFVYPVEGFSPLQAAPTRECARAALLFRSLELIIDELNKMADTNVPTDNKSCDSGSEEEQTLRLHGSDSFRTARASPVDVNTANDTNKISKKAFLISLARIVVTELGTTMRLPYVVVGELLPRLRAYVGLDGKIPPVQTARDFYLKAKKDDFLHLAQKLQHQPHTRLCSLLGLMWTFLEEAQLCDILEHCVVRLCLLYEMVSPDMSFDSHIEIVYLLCGMMQHRQTRHNLVKYVLFGKIKFDNFLTIKSPDEGVLRAALRRPWWQKPTPVQGERDPKIAECEDPSKCNSEEDAKLESQYKADCDNITKTIAPLENMQLEYMLMLLDNSDASNIVPSTRKIFVEKFKRYILDNCILDMRLFNISRSTTETFWWCHARLLAAVLRLWQQEADQRSVPHIPALAVVDGELDFYNVDRLGGVLPYLVRTLRQDLVNILGEESAFIQSFEPTYNRGGGIDTGVTTESLGLATLPQVISSMARFMQAAAPAAAAASQNRPTVETALGLKLTRSVMPGAGVVPARAALVRLTDGLFALYHANAVKYAEKLCELRDNQLDMADCLHDIQQRMDLMTAELAACKDKISLTEEQQCKKHLMEHILMELGRSRNIYLKELETGAVAMSWVRGAVWTRQRQSDIARLLAGALHTLRMLSDADYAAQVQGGSREVLGGKSSVLDDDSYSSLQLDYTSSSDQSPVTPTSHATTPRVSFQSVAGSAPTSNAELSEALFAFTPEYHVDAALELCNTLRLYMHPTVPTHQLPDWEELVTSCATFLCGELGDARVVLASTREALVQTLASFATQRPTMRAIERVPVKQQMKMIEELMRPYQNRAWAQSNWVLVRFWHGSGFGFRHRQWPHLAARYGDREPTVNNLGAKVDAGLMSQCFGPCPSEVIQGRVRQYLVEQPQRAALFLNTLLNQLNWAFSEFYTMMQEIDRVAQDSQLESRQIKLCSTCFDLYHGLARALEMTLCLMPQLLTSPEASDGQNELLIGRTCQVVMAVVSRVWSRGGGGAAFRRLAARGLPDTDRVHHYVALAPIAGCLLRALDPQLPKEHLNKVANALVSEPLFRIEGLEFMLGRGKDKTFSFYNYPDDVTSDELAALCDVVERLRAAHEARANSPGSSAQSELLCTICYARVADTAFEPCGHQSCRTCIMQQLLSTKQCFFCKTEVESVRDIEPNN